MTEQPSRIIFGSCNSQYLEQAIWPAVLDRHAEAFVWGGDAVYGDWFDGRHMQVGTPSKLKADFDWMIDSNPGYQSLMAKNITILGAWDDHDFGVNNGDRTFPYKRENAMAFVDFLERSNRGNNNSERPLLRKRARTGDGVYAVTVFDFARDQPLLTDEEAGIDPSLPLGTPVANLSEKSVAIYTIDVRSHKTPWNLNSSNKTDYQGDFLGEKQWNWLETALKRSPAAVNIVVSGLQVHTDRFVNGKVAEEWSRFPTAQHRLYQALLQPNVQSPLIVSGDVHMGELLRRECQVVGMPSTRRPIIEMTASGMTHSWGTNFCSRPVMSNPVCKYSYFQNVLTLAMHWGHINGAWQELIYDEATHRPQYTLELNFGEFEFDWDQRQVTARHIGLEGVEKVKQVFKLEELSGKSHLQTSSARLQEHHFREASLRMQMLGARNASTLAAEFFCLPYRGPQTAFLKYFGFISSMSIIFVGFLLPILFPLWIVWYCLRGRNGRRKRKID
jgi:alkaline phosphatase D